MPQHLVVCELDYPNIAFEFVLRSLMRMPFAIQKLGLVIVT